MGIDVRHTEVGAGLVTQSSSLFRPARLRLTTEGTSLAGLPRLLRALDAIGTQRHLVLEVENVDHLYIGGLTTLACWAHAKQTTVSTEGLSPHTDLYLKRIGFERIGNAVGPSFHRQNDLSVALSPIGRGQPADILADKIASICDGHGLMGKRDYGALVTALAELIENTIRHAGDPHHGFVAAQLHPARRVLHVAIVDAGMGIEASVASGWNPSIQHGTAKPLLEMVCRPLVTSKPVRSDNQGIGHAGYGLFVVSELAYLNGGTFSLTSGSSTLLRYRKTRRGNSRRAQEYVDHPAWKGTMIHLLLRLDNLLPISEVYSRLPHIEGYDDSDFFDD
ncbi:MAG: sensor histidine kinase [Planctomycetes bacterium]|nr:sensor histidine kinase [Planctomycetota bacterium]